MEDHVFWDEDVNGCKNNAYIGNAEVYEIMFKKPVGAMQIHRDDVIALANCFGLTVYENDSAL